jgi:AraC-like DNA-binding protein
MASVPALRQYLDCADAAGIDYLPLLAAAGIDDAVLEDNNGAVAGSAMQRLVLLLAEATGDACLGLHAARYVEPASYSVLGYITMNCANLGEVLAKIPIYEKIVGDMGVSSTTQMPEHVLQRWECQFTEVIPRRHEVEAVIASWYTYARNFLHVDASFAESVWFEHSAPTDHELLSVYAESFDCEVCFDQPASGILVRREALDKPLSQANEKLLHTLLDYATQIIVEMDSDKTVTEQVKDLLRLMLKESPPSSALIAEKLGMGSRTLQRKLQEEGTHYKDVLNELRLELAMHYLKNSRLSLEVIAGKLGYAEPRSFYRSFKQWTGRTAGSYRSVIGSSE